MWFELMAEERVGARSSRRSVVATGWQRGGRGRAMLSAEAVDLQNPSSTSVFAIGRWIARGTATPAIAASTG